MEATAVPVIDPLGPDSRRSRLRLTETAIGVAVILAVFFGLQFSTPNICCNDYDGYYHARWSQMLGDGIRGADFPVSFTWLPLTVLNSHDYADQQLLYHLLLVPFTLGSNLALGTKVATGLFSSLALCSFFWLLLRYRIPYPLLWLFAILGASSYFLQRLSFTRANSVSLVLLAVAILLLFERKYRWLILVAFLYVWAYNLFVFLWLAVGCWTAVSYWVERRLHWRPLLWVALGTAAGFLINPYFPHNLSLFLVHLRMQTAEAIPAGSEWYPLAKWDLLRSNIGAVIAMLVGCVGLVRLARLQHAGREALQRPLFLFLVSGSLFLLTLHSRRFTEYWAPFAVLFAAFSFAPLMAEPFRFAANSPSRPRRPMLPLLLGSLAVAAVCVYTLAIRKPDLSPPTRLNGEEFAEAAIWMKDHVPAGETVFNVTWASFPKLFYYDPTHAYVSGLDPNYLYFQNRELGRLYARISSGAEPDAASLIRSRFHAEYVFVELYDKGTVRFVNDAERSGKFLLLFRTDHCLILKIA